MINNFLDGRFTQHELGQFQLIGKRDEGDRDSAGRGEVLLNSTLLNWESLPAVVSRHSVVSVRSAAPPLLRGSFLRSLMPSCRGRGSRLSGAVEEVEFAEKRVSSVAHTRVAGSSSRGGRHTQWCSTL